MKRIPLRLTILPLILFIFLSKPAHAYMDPGTSSMIIQATIGACLAAVYAVKVYWRKIVDLFKKKQVS